MIDLGNLQSNLNSILPGQLLSDGWMLDPPVETLPTNVTLHTHSSGSKIAITWATVPNATQIARADAAILSYAIPVNMGSVSSQGNELMFI